MVLFNYSTKEITAKIVYYGPGLCGKTTNLQFIYDDLPQTINKGKMLSLATRTDRTLFFDFLPLDLGTIRGMRTRVQLYTVPGQVFYNTTRKLVLKGADGIIFVADSQKSMLEANIESFKNLQQNLTEYGVKLNEVPLVVQFNKRDLPDVVSIEDLNAAVNKLNAPIYEAVATTGIGVHETLKACTRLVLNSLKSRYAEDRQKKSTVAVGSIGPGTGVPAAVATETPAGESREAEQTLTMSAATTAPQESMAPPAPPQGDLSADVDLVPLEEEYAVSDDPLGDLGGDLDSLAPQGSMGLDHPDGLDLDEESPAAGEPAEDAGPCDREMAQLGTPAADVASHAEPSESDGFRADDDEADAAPDEPILELVEVGSDAIVENVLELADEAFARTPDEPSQEYDDSRRANEWNDSPNVVRHEPEPAGRQEAFTPAPLVHGGGTAQVEVVRGDMAREIRVPIRLTIGDQNISLELRVNLVVDREDDEAASVSRTVVS